MRPQRADLRAGLIVALFSVPEGMAYAAIGGFPPAAGLAAGMAPTAVAGIACRTSLMVTTLTSAIALTARAALAAAGLPTGSAGDVAILTLLTGLAMLLARLLRADRVLGGASEGARTGFALGIAVQIVAGAVRDATGFRCRHHNPLIHLAASGAHYAAWSSSDTVAAWAAFGVWALLHATRRLRAWSVLGALAAVSVLVAACRMPVPTVAVLGAMPGGLPTWVGPNWAVLPRLVPGACAVAAVALAQAAGIRHEGGDGSIVAGRHGSSTVAGRHGAENEVPTRGSDPDPAYSDGPLREAPARSDSDRPGNDRPGSERSEHEAPGRGDDVLAQGAANLVGAFLHALPAGGSVSRTGVAVAAGARTRWVSIFAGCGLAVLLRGASGLLSLIALPAVGGLIIVVGARLAAARLGEARRILRDSRTDALVLAATFAATTELPLQYALLLGLGLSGLTRRLTRPQARIRVS
jgi:SulP family sulfate permease